MTILHLRIPSEYEPPDKAECTCGTCVGVNPYGWEDPRTEPGETIHPRFTPEFLAFERDERLGSAAYGAQHQQRRSPKGGKKFARENLRFFRFADLGGDGPRPDGCVKRDTHPSLVLPLARNGDPELDWLDVTVDATFKKTEDGSNVGLLVVGGRKAQRFVFHDATKKMDFEETCKAILAILQIYPARAVVIELKANGDAIVSSLKERIAAGGIPGVKLVGVESGTGDTPASRANAMIPEVEAGDLYLMEGAPWLRKFVNELCDWPSATRDDRVDALSQCLDRHRHRKTWADTFRPKPAEEVAAASAVPDGRCRRCVRFEDDFLDRADREVRQAPGYVPQQPSCSCERCRRFTDADLGLPPAKASGRRFLFGPRLTR